MMGRLWCQERGVALLLVLSLMVLAVPLVTSALGLASTLSIDSRVKTRRLQSQYCVMAGTQHALYRLLYEAGYAESLVPGVENSYTISCGREEVTVKVQKISDPSSSNPPPVADNARRLQTLKTVNPTTASPLFSSRKP